VWTDEGKRCRPRSQDIQDGIERGRRPVGDIGQCQGWIANQSVQFGDVYGVGRWDATSAQQCLRHAPTQQFVAMAVSSQEAAGVVIESVDQLGS
jgi:hypothetical protein